MIVAAASMVLFMAGEAVGDDSAGKGDDIVPAQSCTGQNCLSDTAKPADTCQGQDCNPPTPSEATQCDGLDCQPIPDQNPPMPEDKPVESPPQQ